MCQIKGAKEVLLLPSNMPKVGYVTEFLENEKYLKGEKLDPSLDLKPRAATVEEGDSLYIPPHWFHAVVPKDGHAGFTSLTVFRSPWHIYGNFFKFFVRRTYTTAWKTAKRQDQRRILQLCCYAFFSQLIRKLTGKG